MSNTAPNPTTDRLWGFPETPYIPLPDEYILEPGDYFLAAGKTHIYRCLSYHSNQIYWQCFDDTDLNHPLKRKLDKLGEKLSPEETLQRLNTIVANKRRKGQSPPFWGLDGKGNIVSATAWSTESSWIQVTDPETGRTKWNHPHDNFPSYLCAYVDIDGKEYTDSPRYVTLRWRPEKGCKQQLLNQLPQNRSSLSSRKVRPLDLPPSTALILAAKRMQEYREELERERLELSKISQNKSIASSLLLAS